MCVQIDNYTNKESVSVCVLTLLMFCRTSCILSGWTADRTKIRVTTSTPPSGTCVLRSSLVRSHWKAQQRSGVYRGFFCEQKAVEVVLSYGDVGSNSSSEATTDKRWTISHFHQVNGSR